MQLSLELKAVVETFVLNELKFILHLLYLSERFERKGLKNISRYLKATAYSKQTTIIKLFRNLKILEDDTGSMKNILDDYYKESNKQKNEIEELARKENLVGCIQTMYFARETSNIEKQELQKTIDYMESNRDAVYKQIVVCPLCGLIITDDVDRCPLCGANKAIFKTF